MDVNKLDPKLLTIGELFEDSEPVYTVPIYQRNFAWEPTHIEQLLGDILDAIHDNKDGYFLGNLIVTEPQSVSTGFEVIDGQQRLTTLYLLLTFLSSSGAPVLHEHQGRLRYKSRPRATEALRRVATESLRHSVSSVHAGSSEDAGILQGYNVIRQFMDQHVSGEVERCHFAKFLCTKVTVVRASLPLQTDFNRYFEIMNTRGQQLQQADIVKARLMQHLDDDAQRACFAWIWDACSEMDSYIQMSLTRGNTDLRTKIFGDDWSWLTVASFETLVIHRPANATTAADALPSNSPTLDDALAKYAKVSAPEKSEDQDNVRFRSIIEFSAFLLHVLKVMRRDDEENEGRLDDKGLIKRFDEFIENSGSEKSREVQKFAFELLRCRNLFDSFVLKRQYTATNSDDGDWSLQRLIKRWSNGRPTPGYINTFSSDISNVEEDGDVDRITLDLLVLQSMLRVTYTSPRTMHWITKLLTFLAESERTKGMESDLATILRDYSREKVKVAFFTPEEPRGFSINRIVFTYLDYLLWEQEGQKPQFRFSFRNSIEHFYPQHPNEQQSGDKVSDECLHMLGNLALVSVGANSKFSNSIPKVKAENFRDTIEVQSPKLQHMAEIARNKGWRDEEVRAHHETMVNCLRQDLRLSPPADSRA